VCKVKEAKRKGRERERDFLKEKLLRYKSYFPKKMNLSQDKNGHSNSNVFQLHINTNVCVLEQ
jgi:hypothetical protein